MKNINFTPTEELLYILEDWRRELCRRMSSLPLEYDRDKDIYVVQEGEHIYVFANPVLSWTIVEDDLGNVVQRIPRYNIYTEILHRPAYSTRDIEYGTTELTFSIPNPRVVITVPMLIVKLNMDGSLNADGADTQLHVPLQQSVDDAARKMSAKLTNC